MRSIHLLKSLEEIGLVPFYKSLPKGLVETFLIKQL